ncbi:MAG: hypothetical protein COB41_01325 [Proteobacteria bacterium]|nr:MAG: hypothetical protein COB41_01325 [Pseudomonadota bacterium]
MQAILTFAIQEGRIVHVDEVSRGDKCGCNCPACGGKLRANQGKIKRHYFSHQFEENCVQALESALHLAAKKVLSKAVKIKLPNLRVEVDACDSLGHTHRASKKLVDARKNYKINNTIIEKSYGNIRADVMLDIEGKELLVEVAVTHFIDEEKLNRIKERNLSTIEIDLSNVPRSVGWKEVEDYVLSGKNSTWVFNKKEQLLKNDLKTELKARVEQENTIIERVKADEIEIRERKERKKELEKLKLVSQVEKAVQDYEAFISNIPDIQRKYEQEVYLHPLWKKISDIFKISSINEAPFFLKWAPCNKCQADCICMYNCDYRFWQSIVFLKFVYLQMGRNYKNRKELIVMIIKFLKRNGIKPQPFYETVSYASHIGIKNEASMPRAWDIIQGFIINLENLGFLRYSKVIWGSPFVYLPPQSVDNTFFCAGCDIDRYCRDITYEVIDWRAIFACKECGTKI